MDDKPPQQGTPDAPDKTKMDQIRRRRLEKLAGRAAPSPESTKRETIRSDSTKSGVTSETRVSESSAVASASSEAVDSAPKCENNESTSPAATELNPFTKRAQDQTNGTTSSTIRINSADGGLSKRTRVDEPLAMSTSFRKSTATPKEETLEEFESRIISNIFRISLEEGGHDDHKLIYLPDLRQELEEGFEPLRLSVGNLDSAILEAASKVPHNKSILDYLLPAWKRTMRAFKGLRGNAKGRDVILKEVKRLCMSNCIFAVTMPELFSREHNPVTDSLTPYLILDPEDDRGICIDFLTEAVSRFNEDDTAKSMLVKAFAGVSNQLSNMTMNDDYKPYVQVLRNFSRFPHLVTAIAEDPLFQMAVSTPFIEKHTLLGPFFRISPLQAEVTRVYFDGPKTMDKGHVLSAQNALRLTLNAHQKDLVEIINAFVRASTISRNRTLDWFAYIVNSNHKRRAIQVDEAQVSSHGFIMNVTIILDVLCEPFMDTTFSKVSKIDVDYLRRNPRVEIHDETKLNADQTTSDKFYEKKLEGSSNFISEVFFLNLAAHHYGSEATNARLKSLERDMKFFQKQIAQIEAERPKFASNPAQLALFEEHLRRYNNVLEKAMSLKFAIEGVLFDDLMQARSLQFMRYVIVFMLRVATRSDYIPGKAIQLPLSEKQPEEFRNLPEYVLDDIVGNFNFIFRFVPQVLISTQTDELITLCITFLRNSEYIKNPYLKSGLVSLLFHGTWPAYHRQKGVLGDALTGEKFANDYLLHSLMKFYIEAESTGTNGQFYEKFNIRYEIFQVIKCIWTNDIYKQRLTQESRVNTEFFVRFVNLLLNDATYVLDESLTKFPKIHELQIALKDPSSLTEEERAAKEEELTTAENQAQSYMQLANETLAMMKLFTAALLESFTMPEIVQRLADMMDYNLDTLVGPKSRDLKVEDASKYHFNPRTLLAEFIDIYLNLGRSPRFIDAVAKDGRSYKPANFDNALRILERFSLKSKGELAAWQALIDKFKVAKELDEQAEEDLGEIPDEYLDPLMATLMEDPVILPTSRQTVDRSTIRSYLLSEGIDPFNRQPLKIEDVISNVQLKEEIGSFKLERNANARRIIGRRMDTTEG